MTYWESYFYTDPVAQALTERFGTKFVLENTGGGCICLYGQLEGGMHVLVGSGIDGPLYSDHELEGIPHNGGYGIGIYDDETGYTLASVADHTAETGADVIALVEKAIGFISSSTDTHCVRWERKLEGSVTTVTVGMCWK
jgi:hypothetical protein